MTPRPWFKNPTLCGKKLKILRWKETCTNNSSRLALTTTKILNLDSQLHNSFTITPLPLVYHKPLSFWPDQYFQFLVQVTFPHYDLAESF